MTAKNTWDYSTTETREFIEEVWQREGQGRPCPALEVRQTHDDRPVYDVARHTIVMLPCQRNRHDVLFEVAHVILGHNLENPERWHDDEYCDVLERLLGEYDDA